jgi:hypothetical protein
MAAKRVAVKLIATGHEVTANDPSGWPVPSLDP